MSFPPLPHLTAAFHYWYRFTACYQFDSMFGPRIVFVTPKVILKCMVDLRPGIYLFSRMAASLPCRLTVRTCMQRGWAAVSETPRGARPFLHRSQIKPRKPSQTGSPEEFKTASVIGRPSRKPYRPLDTHHYDNVPSCKSAARVVASSFRHT